jgi:hypothetical protein
MQIMMNNPKMKTQIKIRMMNIKVTRESEKGDEADASDYEILLKNN